VPPRLLDSGFYPLQTCNAKDRKNPTKTRCFLQLSFCPFMSQSILTTHGMVSIDKGFKLSGRLNVAGWNVAMNVQINVIATMMPSLYADAYMDPLNIGDVIAIGRSVEDMKQGPRFYLDLGHTVPLSAAIFIKGAVSIPILMTTGAIEVKLGKGGFSFKLEALILKIARGVFTLTWKWDMSHFLCAGSFTLGSKKGECLVCKISNGISKLVKGSLRVAQSGVARIKKKLKDSKGLTKSIMQGLCGKMRAKTGGLSRMRNVRRKVCRRAIKTGGAVMNAAMKVAVGVLDVAFNKLIPLVVNMLSAVLPGLMEVLKLAGSALVTALTSFVDIRSYDWKVLLDKGNLKASMKLTVRLMRQNATVIGGELDLGCVGCVAKFIFTRAFKPLINLAANAAKSAREIFDTGIKDAAAPLKKALKSVMKVGFSAGRKVATAGKYAAAKTIGGLWRRRRTEDRRRKWFKEKRVRKERESLSGFEKGDRAKVLNEFVSLSDEFGRRAEAHEEQSEYADLGQSIGPPVAAVTHWDETKTVQMAKPQPRTEMQKLNSLSNFEAGFDSAPGNDVDLHHMRELFNQALDEFERAHGVNSDVPSTPRDSDDVKLGQASPGPEKEQDVEADLLSEAFSSQMDDAIKKWEDTHQHSPLPYQTGLVSKSSLGVVHQRDFEFSEEDKRKEKEIISYVDEPLDTE